MSEAYLEHTNLTVRDPDHTAKMLVDLFDWRIRWSGDAIHNGYTVHVGGTRSYLALFTSTAKPENPVDSFHYQNGLNHLGIVVNDIDAAEKTILAAGFKTRSHADYQPGRRFYFEDRDGLEFEVISYNE